MSKPLELTVTRIGNSRGVRLPAEILRRYQIKSSVILELRKDEIVLRPKHSRKSKLSWEETYKAMAQSGEDWSDWEALPDGLNDIPGEKA